MKIHPNPNDIYAIEGVTRTCFLKNIIKNPNITVGDFTYYDDPDDIHSFEKNVLYHFDFIGDKLIIGKFCQIATGVRFIMNGASHDIDAVSTFPFKILGKSFAKAALNAPIKGNTVIGNDVWVGNSATIMPGVKIGDGAIIGTNALVTKDVEPYSIVGGNPAKEIRKRFDPETIKFLQELAWWNWDINKIVDNLDILSSGNIEVLRKL